MAYTSLLAIYNSRPDLQKAFPKGIVAGTSDNTKLNDWWNTYGIKEYPNVILVQLGDKRIQDPKTLTAEAQQQAPIKEVVSPKEGDTKVENGITYIYSPEGKWELVEKKEDDEEEEKTAYDYALEELLKRMGEKPTDEELLTKAGELYGPYYREEETELTKEYEETQKRIREDYQRAIEEIGIDKEELMAKYEQYLADIETGKLRVGSDFERETARALQVKEAELKEREVQFERGAEALQRQWIGRGGLWAGPRYEAAGEYQSDYQRALQNYLAGTEYEQAGKKSVYERAMEDYATRAETLQREKGYSLEKYQGSLSELETAKTRGLYDIAQEEARKRRSLKEEEKRLYETYRLGALQSYY